MDNHLIIGLGGTGGKIIRSMRKMIYQNLRQEEPDHINLRFLYVDSDDEMMGIDDETWKTLGKSVQLGKQSQLVISGMNLSAILNDVNSYPGIKHWIGDRRQWRGLLQSSEGANVMGGQKRRLGRFLFASKVKEFNNHVNGLVQEMSDGGQVGTTFHVCAGLAGGTGSGTVIDAICQIRNKHNLKKDRIFLYLLLPDRNPLPNWAGPNYHANGYAALRELNALAVGAFRPHDLTGRSFKMGDHSGESGRLRVQDPFNGCYLFTDQNAAGFRVNVARELPEVTASFLYHKIVTAGSVGGGLNQLTRQEDFQIGSQAISGEREVEDGPETRSRRFFAFGIKQLAYPEEEILEYLAFSFARQAALQLRFNHWSDGIGFADAPRNLAFDSYVRGKETQNRWRITDNHLTLSLGILDEEVDNKKWKPIPNEWQSVVDNFITLAQQDQNTENWSTRLSQLCEKRFTDDFRGQGVQTWYQQRAKIRRRHVREIRSRIEEDLFASWMSGEYSMQELSQLLKDLRREIEERRTRAEGEVSKQQDKAETSLNRIKENDAEWAKIGWLSASLMGKREKLLKAKGVLLQSHYAARTWVQAWTFAQRLLTDLIDELDELRGQVDRAASTLSQAIEYFEEHIQSRIADEGEADLTRQVVRFYEPEVVRDLAGRLVQDEQEQKKQAAQVRRRLAERVGPHPGFGKFNERVRLSDIIDIFQAECAESAHTAHDSAMAESGGAGKLLSVSILDKLEERFSANGHQLHSYLDKVIKQARTYVRFSDAERARSVPGQASMFSTFTIIRPEAPDESDFVDVLDQTFKKAAPDGVVPDILPSTHRQNEIVLLNVASAFPLRYLEPLENLRQEYDRRVNGPDERATLEVHLEGDGTQLPRLHQPGQEELEADARPYLLLARAMNIFEVREDRSGNVTDLVLVLEDEHGLPTDEISLGASLPEAMEKLTPAVHLAITNAVDGELRSAKYNDAGAREDVTQRIVDEAKAMRNGSGNGAHLAFANSARDAIQMLEHSISR